MKSADESDEEDEIVKEMDVYLSKSLCGQLYMLQYPIQNVARKYCMQDRSLAKIKPKNNKMEMEVALDISSTNYDQSKGEQIALNVDGSSSTAQASTTFENNMMDKQTLSSSCMPTQGKRYIVGCVQNDEIHLTPVSHVLQLKPSFKYMDRAEQRASQAAKAKAAGEGDSSQDEAEEARAITVRFKGAETEAARLARERSYAAYEKRIAEEKWVTTKFHNKKDSYAERERQRLICQNVKQVDKIGASSSGFSEMVQTPSQYLTELVPVYTEHAVDKSGQVENILSLSQLQKESLPDQLKMLMKNTKIILFSQLMSLLPRSCDTNTVIRSLQSHAVLVKGCWIVKSDLLFPAGTQSPISGTSSESLCRSRDYILYLFTKQDYVVRKQVTNTVKIPGDDVKAILDDIAIMRVGHGWQLRLDPDISFMKRYPEVCERQAMLWAAQAIKLSKLFGVVNELDKDMGNVQVTSPRKKTSSTGDISTSPVTKQQAKTAAKRQRKTSGQKSSPSKTSSVKSNKNKTVPPPEAPAKANLANNFLVKAEPRTPTRVVGVQPQPFIKNEPQTPPRVAGVQSFIKNEPLLSPVAQQPFVFPNIATTPPILPQPNIADGQVPSVASSMIPQQPFVIYSPTHEPFVRQLTTQSPPNQHLNATVSGSPKINIAGVNSTIQSVANHMRKIGSPQYFIPQMNISNLNFESYPEVAQASVGNTPMLVQNGAAAAEQSSSTAFRKDDNHDA